VRSSDNVARDDVCNFLNRHHMLSDEAKHHLEDPELHALGNSGHAVRMLDLERALVAKTLTELDNVDGVDDSNDILEQFAADTLTDKLEDPEADAAIDSNATLEADMDPNGTFGCIAQLLHFPHSMSQCTLSPSPCCIEEEKLRSSDNSAGEDLCKFLKRHHMLSDEAEQQLEHPGLQALGNSVHA